MAESNQDAQDLTQAETKAAATDVAERTVATGGDQVDAPEPSKNALKKAAKQEKLAAEKANKSSSKNVSEVGKTEARKAVAKHPLKKIPGAALIGIDVAKEDDFAGWYQQVLTKGDMLDYYDVSGCYILKVRCWLVKGRSKRRCPQY